MLVGWGRRLLHRGGRVTDAQAQWEVRLFSWVYLVFIRHGLK